MIFFDFSKAFDRVSHSKLMFKLSKIGSYPLLQEWLCECIHRTLQVKVKNTFSTSRNVASEVPQEGVLSPILFSIYTADLPVLLLDSRVEGRQFADDLKIYCEFVEVPTLSNHCCYEFHIISFLPTLSYTNPKAG